MASLFQVNVSNGGVPKSPVRGAAVTAAGVVGDRQEHTEVHGGPDRAVCLYSLERILALQAEGHPIFPGAAGENLTVTGLPWDALVPGVRLQAGPDLLLEIASYTAPCKLISRYFADGDAMRISQEAHPGWARVYARVLEPGEISIGDELRIV
jgi:MOSC domain-containing protein YiiM